MKYWTFLNSTQDVHWKIMSWEGMLINLLESLIWLKGNKQRLEEKLSVLLQFHEAIMREKKKTEYWFKCFLIYRRYLHVNQWFPMKIWALVSWFYPFLALNKTSQHYDKSFHFIDLICVYALSIVCFCCYLLALNKTSQHYDRVFIT